MNERGSSFWHLFCACVVCMNCVHVEGSQLSSIPVPSTDGKMHNPMLKMLSFCAVFLHGYLNETVFCVRHVES